MLRALPCYGQTPSQYAQLQIHITVAMFSKPSWPAERHPDPSCLSTLLARCCWCAAAGAGDMNAPATPQYYSENTE